MLWTDTKCLSIYIYTVNYLVTSSMWFLYTPSRLSEGKPIATILGLISLRNASKGKIHFFLCETETLTDIQTPEWLCRNTRLQDISERTCEI